MSAAHPDTLRAGDEFTIVDGSEGFTFRAVSDARLGREFATTEVETEGALLTFTDSDRVEVLL